MAAANHSSDVAVRVRRPFQDITNHSVACSPTKRPNDPRQAPTPTKSAASAPAASFVRKKPARFQRCWSRAVLLKYLWYPLGCVPWTLEVSHDTHELVRVFEALQDWTIVFIKDFSEAWRPGLKYEARLLPNSELDPVAQHLFLATPSLHSCIVAEGQGFLWLNKLGDEPFVRCNWLEDKSASVRILPPLNLCFDLDDTLIFNAPVRGARVPLDYVVREPPNMLVEDMDPNGEVYSSDSPFVRPLICQFLELVAPYFRNIRVASFSVGTRAKEVVGHLDRNHTTLLKNFRPDPITNQKPVANVVFGREFLLLQGHVLGAAERQLIKSGAAFWLKSLEMVDLPLKGLLQRTIILDDRTDVWVEANQDNVVKITGPDRPENVGNPAYLNGIDGGEIGQRMLLGLINLELKFANSSAYRPLLLNQQLPAKRRLPVPAGPAPASEVCGSVPPPPLGLRGLCGCAPSGSPPAKAPRPGPSGGSAGLCPA